MTDSLQALRLFSRVARTGSFSRAGRENNLSQPSVSRIIADLEKSIGVQLLTRTTRALTLTEAGTDYLARIEPILTALEEADHAARGTGELRGLLRVGLSSSFSVRVVIPRLPGFLDKHPALRLDLVMEDRRQDLVSEGVDVALRFGPPGNSTAMARKITTARRVLVASPKYLKRAGTPASPADLASHAVILGPTTNANEGAVAAATAGLGICSTGEWGSAAERKSGALVEVLPDWKMESVEIHAVFPAGRAAKPSARAFAEYLARSFKT
jgi:DNA-binding transcriptional LysR family regulator